MGITLVPHDAGWADIYERTAADILDALAGAALSIDHVGSTAIPGIDSKPVIDILVLVKSYDPEEAYRMPLESLGYVFKHRETVARLLRRSSLGDVHAGSRCRGVVGGFADDGHVP